MNKILCDEKLVINHLSATDVKWDSWLISGTGEGLSLSSLVFSYTIPLLLHIHVLPPYEVYDSSDQAVHYTCSLQLSGLGVKKVFQNNCQRKSLKDIWRNVLFLMAGLHSHSSKRVKNISLSWLHLHDILRDTSNPSGHVKWICSYHSTAYS
jgi:hypothetical protein